MYIINMNKQKILKKHKQINDLINKPFNIRNAFS